MEVPFGRRRAVGVVVASGLRRPGIVAESPDKRSLDTSKIKNVAAVIDDEPVVPQTLLDLSLWVADYYIAAPGLALRLAAPPGGVATSKRRVALTDRGRSLLSDGDRSAADPLVTALLTAKGPLAIAALSARLQRDVSSRIARLERDGVISVLSDIDTTGFQDVLIMTALPALAEEAPTLKGRAADVARALVGMGGVAPIREVVHAIPSARSAIRALEKRNLVSIEKKIVSRASGLASGEGDTSSDRSPSAEQRQAIEGLHRSLEKQEFASFLLEGVTGSGKTEVYLRCAERALALGRTSLLLVPEIGLTSPLVSAARQRFGSRVSVLHSDMADGVRHDEWWRARRGEARVIVGARSAVFAPVERLGLIVVDEEHDAAYKQEDSPRYNARDVAVYRAHLEGATVVLGSATPSLETRANAMKGRYEWLRMKKRIGAWGLAKVEVIDRRKQKEPGAILTPPLVTALSDCLSRGEQSLLLLNRRGYATSLVCRECGVAAQCPHCSVTLVLHRRGDEARCHYCGLVRVSPSSCGSCGGVYLKLQGFGTQRISEVLSTAIPQARVDRVDRDVASLRGAVEKVLARFARHETDILVGTQMIAKGHDFPKVTLVGVIDADVGLGLPDFRSAERTFALLTQVAGRAGRADLAGQVLLQTHNPAHYAIDLARHQDYDSFFEREMEFRKTMGYPPERSMVNVVFRGPSEQAVAKEARDLARTLKERRGFAVLGPSPSPLAKVRDEYRYQVVLRGARNVIRTAAGEVLRARFGALRWPGVSVDVDPMSLM